MGQAASDSEGRAKSNKVLVVGGAGYIGAHTTRELVELGYDVTVFDDLSRGHSEQVEGVPLVTGRLEDREAVNRLLGERQFDAVFHFASESLVGESVKNPDKYFQRNVGGALSLLSAMTSHNVRKLVFSSSASVYGEPKEVPIRETFPLDPKSPYGECKLFIERALNWYDRAYGLRSASLRYFNAAGASHDASIGEDHEPETHLIPLAIRAALLNEPLTVFGDDYPTPDGTCIRDYVHVVDLAKAHVLALEALDAGSESLAVNLGAGRGYSNFQIIAAIERVSGRKVPYTVGPRRPGDSAILIASNDKAKELLGWVPRHSSLEEIIETAWRWHSRTVAKDS